VEPTEIVSWDRSILGWRYVRTKTLFHPAAEFRDMADENSDPDESTENGETGDEKSFRERVEEIREQRSEEGDEEKRERMEEMMGGGGGMGGGNPFAQMMGGMMGGGPGAGPPGPGAPGSGADGGNEELVREVRQLRDEVRDITRHLQRIADAMEDDD
jgi:hypothetical protein